MPLVITPRQFTQRGQFYHQLAQLTAAGIPVIQALDMLSRNPPSRNFRKPIQAMLKQLAQGATITESLQSVHGWMPDFDIALVQAGEQSGRLDAVFRILAQHYDERASLLRQVISDMLYPLFVLHFAVFIFSFISWFQGPFGPWVFFVNIAVILGPIYLVTFFIIYSMQRKHGLRWRAWVERLLWPVPVLGTARHYLALSRLSASLEALINAGVTIIEAWELAAAASGSPAILRTVLAWKPQVASGSLPSEAVNAHPRQFPEVFANLYFSGETSGQLDESLRRLHKYYQEEGTLRLRLLSRWVPKMIYFAICLTVAYKIIMFYNGLYGSHSLIHDLSQ